MADKIGFVGLGIMGKPMALNLVKSGIQLMVNDLNMNAVKELTDTGAAHGSLEAVGSECDLIFTILPNGKIVQDVLLGEGGIARSMKKGGLLCDMSSVAPMEARRCAEMVAAFGLSFVDAPVSGGEPKAVDGSLAFMAGGKEEDFQRLAPYFSAMGSSAVLVGDVGSGCVTKLANQVIVNLNIAAVSEAFVLASKAGADPEKVYQAIRGGLAGSTVLDAKLPMILDRNFAPGGKISVNHKDIKNVLDTAHAMDVPMPFSAMLFEILQSLKVHGHMEDDHSGIVQYFEKLADYKVTPKNS